MYKTKLIASICILLICFLNISPTQCATSRPVVIEDFTGTWCGFCFGANKALDKIEQMIDNVIVIEYHVDDEFSLPENNERSIEYNAEAFPTVMFNGIQKQVGGSSKADGYYAYNNVYLVYADTVNQLKESMPDQQLFELNVYGTLVPEDCEFRTVIKSNTEYPNQVELILLLVQDNIQFQAANGLDRFDAVVTQWIARETIQIDTAGEFEITSQAFIEIPEEDLKDIRPVAILQDQTTKEILMAVDNFTEPTAVTEWQLHQ